MSASVMTIEGKGSYISRQISNSEQSTQQATCYTKHAITNRIPVTATLIRVNEASDWNDQLLSIKKKLTAVLKGRLSRNLVLMRGMCTLFGKVAGA